MLLPETPCRPRVESVFATTFVRACACYLSCSNKWIYVLLWIMLMTTFYYLFFYEINQWLYKYISFGRYYDHLSVHPVFQFCGNINFTTDFICALFRLRCGHIWYTNRVPDFVPPKITSLKQSADFNEIPRALGGYPHTVYLKLLT
jgi:hypothetical protein